jgi:V8-like Glu-specific endopeptidase
MMSKIRSVLLLGSALAIGCSDGHVLPRNIEMLHSPLIGGTADAGDPAVVALFAHARGDQTGQGAICTATFISQRVLLTAAHCVSPQELANLGSNIEFLVITSDDLNSAGPGSILPVQETHFDPMFNSNDIGNGHDVGVAILSQAHTVTPIPFNQTPMSSQMIGQSVRLVGYGVSDVSGNGSGVKRQLTTQLDNFDYLLLQIGDTGHQTCQGDSGGPAMMHVNNVETIVGVTSFGNQDCSMGGFDTRIDEYTQFINQYLGGSTCTPNCAGRNCGSDGCGHTCGTCGSNETCSSTGQCMTPPPPTNQCEAHGGYEYEPNDAGGLANELCTNMTIHGRISRPNDSDWYHWTVSADHEYAITLSGLSQDYTMHLFKQMDGQPEWVASAVDNHDGSDQSITRRSAIGGTYYLQVVGVNGANDPGAPYLVSVSIQ